MNADVFPHCVQVREVWASCAAAVETQNQNQKFTRMTRYYRTLLKFGFFTPWGGQKGLYHWRHRYLALRYRRALEGIEGHPAKKPAASLAYLAYLA